VAQGRDLARHRQGHQELVGTHGLAHHPHGPPRPQEGGEEEEGGQEASHVQEYVQ